VFAVTLRWINQSKPCKYPLAEVVALFLALDFKPNVTI
jgi:hypothetical protein